MRSIETVGDRLRDRGADRTSRWSSSAALAGLAAVLTHSATACGPASIVPGSVAVELPAFNVADCVVAGSTCEHRGNVVASHFFSSSAPTSIQLDPGSGIDTAFARPPFDGSLHALAIGLRAVAGTTQAGVPFELDVRFDGQPRLQVTTGEGVRRIEVEILGDGRFDPGARLHLEAVAGAFELAYVEGLWNAVSPGR